MADLAGCRLSDVKPFTLAGVSAPCKIVRVYDGDTVHIALELFGTLQRITCRLVGIEAPEIKSTLHKTSALAARNRLIQLGCSFDIALDDNRSDNKIQCLLDRNTRILQAELQGADKYGRWLTVLRLQDGTCINDVLVNEMHALRRVYDN